MYLLAMDFTCLKFTYTELTAIVSRPDLNMKLWPNLILNVSAWSRLLLHENWRGKPKCVWRAWALCPARRHSVSQDRPLGWQIYWVPPFWNTPPPQFWKMTSALRSSPGFWFSTTRFWGLLRDRRDWWLLQWDILFSGHWRASAVAQAIYLGSPQPAFGSKRKALRIPLPLLKAGHFCVEQWDTTRRDEKGEEAVAEVEREKEVESKRKQQQWNRFTSLPGECVLLLSFAGTASLVRTWAQFIRQTVFFTWTQIFVLDFYFYFLLKCFLSVCWTFV